MGRVKLGDIARECRLTYTGNKSGIPIVGLEHLTPGDIVLHSWDIDTDNTFNKYFKKGQVLLGRRRVYLKKAAVAPFDGICSGDITVIEAIPERLQPELLPFIIQNDRFFEFAIVGSAGSLSPRVKWEYLKDYEIELADLHKQSELVELLKSANELKHAYQEMLTATDEMVKSQFIEKTSLSSSPLVSLKDVVSIVRKSVNPVTGKTYTLYSFPAYDNQQNPEVVDGGEIRSCKLDITPNTVLYNKLNVRLCRVWNIREIATTNNICSTEFIPLKMDNTVLLQEYLVYFLTSEAVTKAMVGISQGTSNSQKRIAPEALLKLEIPLPPIEIQKEFVAVYKKSDKSKFELKQAIEKIDKVMQTLMR